MGINYEIFLKFTHYNKYTCMNKKKNLVDMNKAHFVNLLLLFLLLLLLQKFRKYKKIILDSNPDILTKDFPSGRHLCDIAAKISKDWKTKYYLFKLEESDVEDITQGPDRDDPVGQRLGY